MSKFISVPNGDFTVKTQSDGKIRLDTGPGQGEVRVTGDLVVEGDTVTVQSTNLEIEDNILLLNRGETGSAVGEGTSGIRIDRGTAADGDAQILFDETIEHTNPNAPSTEVFGTFTFRRTDGGNVGIQAPSIVTGGSELFLDTSGNGVRIMGSAVTYATGLEDEHLINKYYLDQYVDATLTDLQITKVEDGNTGIFVTDATDNTNQSRIQYVFDSTVTANFFPDRIELNDLRISGQTIAGTISNQDIVLDAPGTGTVKINDVLQIAETPGTDDPLINPLQPTDGVKIYSKSEGPGQTGIYYVNTSNTNDELISRNRALLYGYLL